MSDPARTLPNGPGTITVSQQKLIDAVQDLTDVIIHTSSAAPANYSGTVNSSPGGTSSLTGLFGQAGARGKAGMAYKDAMNFGTKEVQERARVSADNFKLTRRLFSEIESIHSLVSSLEVQTKFFDDQRKNRIASEAGDALFRKNRFDNDLKGMKKFQMLLLGNVGYAKTMYMKQMKEMGKELVETRKVRIANRKVMEGIDKEIGYQKANQDVVSAIEDKFGYVGKLFSGFKTNSADKEEMLTENKGVLGERLKFEENRTRAEEKFKRARPGSSEYNALKAQLGAYNEKDAYDRNPIMDENDRRVYKENIGYNDPSTVSPSVSSGSLGVRTGTSVSENQSGPGVNREGKSPNSPRGITKTKRGKIKPTKQDILKLDALPGEQTLFLTNALGITDGKKGKGGLLDGGDESNTQAPNFLSSLQDMLFPSLVAGGGLAAALAAKRLQAKSAAKAAKAAKDAAKAEAKLAKEALKSESKFLPKLLSGLSKFGKIGKYASLAVAAGAAGLSRMSGAFKGIFDPVGKAAAKASQAAANAATSGLRLNSAGRVINSSGKFASAAEAAAFKTSQAAENASTSGLRLNSAGRVINSSGKFASAAEAAAFKTSQAAENAGSKAVGSGLKGASKFLGKGLPFLGPLLQAGFTADEIYEIQKNNDLTAEQKAIQTESAAAGGVGSLVGGGIGAAIGTVLLGPLGTVLGGMAGSFFGESLARLISENRYRGPEVTNQQVLAANGLSNKQVVGPNGIVKTSFTAGLGDLAAANVVKAKEDEYYKAHPERKRPVMGDTFEDAYIESNGTIHQKDPRDKILFFQDPNTIEIVKNTKSEAKQENMSGSPLSNDTMVELLQSILKELKFSNNKKDPIPKMDILGGKNLLMGSM